MGSDAVGGDVELEWWRRRRRRRRRRRIHVFRGPMHNLETMRSPARM
jgi:hypothetical protein